MLKFGTKYVARSLADDEAQVREDLERGVRRKARSLGYDLVPRPRRRSRSEAPGRRRGAPR